MEMSGEKECYIVRRRSALAIRIYQPDAERGPDLAPLVQSSGSVIDSRQVFALSEHSLRMRPEILEMMRRSPRLA